MKTNIIILIIVLCLLPLSVINAQVVDVEWNTFMGSGSNDYGLAVTRSASGNLCVTGYGYATWGSPVNAPSGGSDAFVACLDSSGNRLWNTFLGSGNDDAGHGIACDSSDNIYVVGYSFASWGTPVNAYSGTRDVFVAALDSSGNLLWNTFLGSGPSDWGFAISLDISGKLYITGYSEATWGTPLNAHSGVSADAFVACLDNSGNLVWNTFLGGTLEDLGRSIAVNSAGSIYVTGGSEASWGSPVNAHSGHYDGFVASLDSSGNLLWNTFFGSSTWDLSYAIALDSSGNIYVTGHSYATWGSPVNAHSGEEDVFAAALNSSGSLLWSTFLGAASDDYGHDIALDNSGNIYVTGFSYATWGSPVHAFNGDADAFVACLGSSGILLWNTFMGNTNYEYGYGITVNGSGKIYVTGHSNSGWGSPINGHSGALDVFMAKLAIDPYPDIKANGSDGPISITESDTLQIRVLLNPYGLSDNADFWLAYKGPSGWVHFNNTTKSWETGLAVTYQGALFYLKSKKVFQSSGLALGEYTFYFGIDLNMNGKVTKSSLYKDEVKVTVTQ
jgi:hypothetical protein